MVFSYNELSKLVDLSGLDPEKLRNRLTFAGFEVEGMEKLARATHLVIGKILTCVPHPDSDHLHLLTVDCGGKIGVLDIVCGAPNARSGLKVIVALPGAELPAIGEVIKPGEIRGKTSNGMCCSLVELGVSKDVLSEKQVNGIEELKEDAAVGCEDVLSALGLDDTLLDINVLPNRPDCLSYIGMAREISALCNVALSPVPDKMEKGNKILLGEIHTPSCLRFDLLSVKNVEEGKTPEDMASLLTHSGIRLVSPLVDLGNAVMLLSGQPFNLYDEEMVKDGFLDVRDDYEGEFVGFDSKKSALAKGDLVIVDKSGKPLCLAGIQAGKGALISASTKSFVAEAAVFYHKNIRHTSSRLGLSSPSSQLFSKERNPAMIDEAWAIFESLLPRFLKKYTLDGYSSCYPDKEENPWFAFSLEKLNHRLGSSYTEEDCQEVIKAFRIDSDGKGNVRGPKDRVDLLEQCDMDEEVFRYFGAERIHPSLSSFPITRGALLPSQKEEKELEKFLLGRGMDQILTYTLIDENSDSLIRVFSKDPSYRILNPMTKDHEFVRSDLIPSLLSVIRYNESHGHSDLSLFEISPIDTVNGVKKYLSFALVGRECLSEGYQARPYSFFDLKGLVEGIFAKLGISASRFQMKPSRNPSFHPGMSADVYSGKEFLGTFGALHPTIDKDETLVGELDLSLLLSLPGRKVRFSPLKEGLLVRRDISFEKKEGVSYSDLIRTLSKARDPYFDHAEFFDDFTDPANGKEYLGLSLYLRKKDGTSLKNPEIESSVKGLGAELVKNLSIVLRGEEK